MIEPQRSHPHLFNEAEALAYLRLPPDGQSTLKEYHEKGLLKGYPVGVKRAMIYHKSDLDQFVLQIFGRLPDGQESTSSQIDHQRAPTPVLTYFIQEESGGCIKIGKTLNIRVRLATLQAGCPNNLVCLGWLRSDREEELHKRFAKHRRRGEWFDPAQEILDFIHAHAGVADILADGEVE